jgi:hypothetical protein
VQFLPTAIDDLLAGQHVELVTLNRVNNLDGFADDGNVIEPASRRQPFLVELEDAVGELVAFTKVVEEPAVEIRRAQGRLNRGDARGMRFVRRTCRGRVLRACGRDGDEQEEQQKDERGACVDETFHVVCFNLSNFIRLI